MSNIEVPQEVIEWRASLPDTVNRYRDQFEQIPLEAVLRESWDKLSKEATLAVIGLSSVEADRVMAYWISQTELYFDLVGHNPLVKEGWVNYRQLHLRLTSGRVNEAGLESEIFGFKLETTSTENHPTDQRKSIVSEELLFVPTTNFPMITFAKTREITYSRNGVTQQEERDYTAEIIKQTTTSLHIGKIWHRIVFGDPKADHVLRKLEMIDLMPTSENP